MNRQPSLRAATLLLVLILLVTACSILQSPPPEDLLPTLIPSPTTNPRVWINENQQQGRAIQALYQLEAQAAVEGWTAERYKEAGNLWNAIGEINRALPYWEAAAQQSPDPSLLRQIAAAHIRLQNWGRAQQTLENLLATGFETNWASYQLGLLLAPSNSRSAINFLQQLAESPTFGLISRQILDILNNPSAETPTSLRIGFVYTQEGMWPYAELAFRQAVEDSYPPGLALAYLGYARDRQGKDGSAAIKQAITLNPENTIVNYLYALHLRQNGEYLTSLETLIVAANLDPSSPLLIAEVGTAYRLLGNLEQAEYWLQVALTMSGGAAVYRELLDSFYADEAPAMSLDAVAALQESASNTVPSPETLSGFGWSLHTIGQTDEGLAQIDKALAIDPNNPRALYDKARILIEIEQTGDAITLLQRVAAGSSIYAADAQRLLDGLSANR